MFRPVFLRRLSPRPLPATLLTGAFVAVFNHGMRGQTLIPRLRELEGKRVRVCATDLPWALEVTVGAQGLCMTERGEAAHVTLRGSLADLRRLATRSEDPDTLFFERRLCIEGETQTGLLIKNLLDALDWDWEAHLRSVLPGPLAGPAIMAGRPLQHVMREQ